MSAQKREYFGRALTALIPDGIGYAIDDSVEEFKDIIWAQGTPYITEVELITEADKLQKEYEETKYREARFMEYPAVRELADALYWLHKGDSSKMDEYVSKCDAVKQKYPK